MLPINPTKSFALGLLVAFLLLVLAPVGRASEDPALELYQRAQEEFSMARLKASLRTLRRAKELASDIQLRAKISLQMGVVLAVFNKTVAAQQEFRTALQLVPTTDLDRQKTKSAIVNLFDEARKTVTGTVRVVDYNPGAKVLVDGEEMGVVPVTLTLPVGQHLIKVRLVTEQWETEGLVTVAFGQTQTFEKGLDVMPPIVTTPPNYPEPEPEPSPWKLYTGLVGLGIGAGLVVTGVVYGLKVSQANEDFKNAETIDEQRSIKSDAEGWETIELATLISGGVVMAAGAGLLIWHVLEPSNNYPEEQRTVWLPLISPGQVGISAAMRF